MVFDALVLGAGPAGLAVARALAKGGMRVGCVAPRPEAAWDRTFGLWGDDLAALERDLQVVQASWSRPLVHLGDGPRDLGRAYHWLDVPALQRQLLSSAADRGVELVEGEVTAAHVGAPSGQHQVRLRSGAAVEASIVVDATGAANPWVRRRDARAPAFQTARGRVIEVDGHPWADGEMSFMDLRPIDGVPGPTTFLYALPLGPRRVFVEETSLVARPAVGDAILASRLDARLRSLDLVDLRGDGEEERCFIPMGVALPVRDQPILAFGAAAGMVHPATGYQLGRALAVAPRVAAALLAAGGPATRVRQAYDVIWPPDRRRAWELYTFGMEALLRLDGDALRSFFRAFFDLPSDVWLPYLRGASPSLAILKTMLGVLRRAETPTRRALFRFGPGEERALLRAIAGSMS